MNMKAIIIAQSSNKKQDANNSLSAQIERLKFYCQKKGLDVVKEFSLGKKSYQKQQDKIDEIINALAEQHEPVAVCFDRENHLIHKIFNDKAHQLFEQAIKGEIELHFLSECLILDKNSTAVDKFRFHLSFLLAKHYTQTLGETISGE